MMSTLQSIVRFCCSPPSTDPKRLRKTLHRYRATYTAYLTCVHALSNDCENGLLPQRDAMAEEQAAFDEFASARRALLDTLAQKRNGTERKAPHRVIDQSGELRPPVSR